MSKGFFKAGILAIIGCATAGGWLVVDLLLPDPVGDYLLYILMAVVNGAIGFQIGRSSWRKRATTVSKIDDARRSAVECESES